MTMKLHLNPLMSVGLLLSLTTSCGDEPEPKGISDNPWVGITDSLFYKENPLWQLHKDSPLKILAIGNSYTNNATTYMSWLIHRLNGDSICIARLTQGGCTLEKHWDNHVGNASGYYFDYSDRGHWATCDINSLDEALALLDWDVITIQQYSGLSGVFSSYQPYLSNLLALFRYSNSNALLAWHYTWTYTEGADRSDFKRYDYDAENMYKAIMDAGNKGAEYFDILIPSATLIKVMREEFPDAENGFSSDGSHIDDEFALYALSSLWYDILVGPFSGCSRKSLNGVPWDVKEEGFDKVEDIIKSILDTELGT